MKSQRRSLGLNNEMSCFLCLFCLSFYLSVSISSCVPVFLSVSVSITVSLLPKIIQEKDNGLVTTTNIINRNKDKENEIHTSRTNLANQQVTIYGAHSGTHSISRRVNTPS